MNKMTLFDQKIFETFVKSREVVEVRIPKTYGKSPAWGNDFARGTVSGYFDNFNAFCNAVKAADKSNHSGIYFTLQVIDPRLIGRAFNRLKPSDLTTSDNNVIAYRWLPIDIDPVRPAGVGSSDKELKHALEIMEDVEKFVIKNLQFPKPIKGMSGNGGHLLFRLLDLPINENSKTFIKNILEMLSSEFSSNTVKIDTVNFNPARIWKLYGTTARKGDFVPEGNKREARPYRQSYIDGIGA